MKAAARLLVAIIVDACIVMAWIFEDERDAYALASAEHVEANGGFAPVLWRWEVQNALLTALRRGRISSDEIAAHVEDLQALPISFDGSAAFGVEFALAREHNLTVYDAAYLEVAMRRGCALATADADLARAAKSLGLYFSAG